MKNRFPKLTANLAVMSLILGFALSASAQPGWLEGPGRAERPPLGVDHDPEPRSLLRQWVQLHMELGQHHILAGNYSHAREAFLAVAGLDSLVFAHIDTPLHLPPRVAYMQRQAYLMAAVATFLMGDEDQAMQLALVANEIIIELPERRGRGRQAGADSAPEGGRGLRRGEAGHGAGQGAAQGQGRGAGAERRSAHSRRADDGDRYDPVSAFLENPREFCQRFAGGVDGIETRILEIEHALRQYVDQ